MASQLMALPLTVLQQMVLQLIPQLILQTTARIDVRAWR
jgi:hypothetical protein